MGSCASRSNSNEGKKKRLSTSTNSNNKYKNADSDPSEVGSIKSNISSPRDDADADGHNPQHPVDVSSALSASSSHNGDILADTSLSSAGSSPHCTTGTAASPDPSFGHDDDDDDDMLDAGAAAATATAARVPPAAAAAAPEDDDDAVLPGAVPNWSVADTAADNDNDNDDDQQHHVAADADQQQDVAARSFDSLSGVEPHQQQVLSGSDSPAGTRSSRSDSIGSAPPSVHHSSDDDDDGGGTSAAAAATAASAPSTPLSPWEFMKKHKQDQQQQSTFDRFIGPWRGGESPLSVASTLPPDDFLLSPQLSEGRGRIGSGGGFAELNLDGGSKNDNGSDEGSRRDLVDVSGGLRRFPILSAATSTSSESGDQQE